jgi:cytochrome b6-f complex iron-sulfur subunit
MGISLAAFGGASLAFLWPQSSGGFGSKIRVGDVEEVKQQIRDANGFLYVPEGRMWITEYPAAALDKARAVYSPGELAGMEAGVIALYQKCVHLGCRVPECETSQWFECPCHGSQYNQVGEKKGGPAPRGLDRFSMSVDGGVLTVDTGVIIQGPPIGTNTTGQEAEGPHCISAGGGEH